MLEHLRRHLRYLVEQIEEFTQMDFDGLYESFGDTREFNALHEARDVARHYVRENQTK